MKYKTLYVDPAWNEVGGGRIKRGADRHYPLMKTKDIIAMKDWINDISDANSHLYLWVTNNFLIDGFKVMEEWGFRYVTMITWTKTRIGLGQYYRGMTEHCLFGVKGKVPYKIINGKRCQGTTSIIEPSTKHSKKPEKMYEYIETVSYGPYIELFAREKRPGWDCWGNEVD
jgi:N6-adenosine-specific RNA methylase IME4